jgi:CBS domain-containing protein
MVSNHVAIHESATLKKAVKLMEDKHLLVLPFERNGLIE